MRIFINMNTLLYNSFTVKSEDELMNLEFYRNIQINEGNIELVKKLIENKFDVYILSCSLYNQAITQKKNWITKNIPTLKRKNILLFTQNENFFSLIKGTLNNEDIYLDKFNKANETPAIFKQFQNEGGTSINLENLAIETYDDLLKNINDKIDKTEIIKIGSQNYIHYSISYVEHGECYEGYKSQHDESDIFDKNDKNYVIGKLDFSEMSFLLRNIIKKMLSDKNNIKPYNLTKEENVGQDNEENNLSPSSNNLKKIEDAYKYPFSNLNKLIRSAISGYENITDKQLLSSLNIDIQDINMLRENNPYIVKDKDSLIIQNNIIELLDFYHEKKKREEINKLNIEYYLTQAPKLKEEIEKMEFSVEYSRQK